MWWTIGQVQVGAVAGVAAHLNAQRQGDQSTPWVESDYTGSGGFVLAGLGLRL